MRRAFGLWAVWGAFGLLTAAGCTSLLGDFTVGAEPGGLGADGGGGETGPGTGDAQGTPDGTGPGVEGGTTDGPGADSADASTTVNCAFVTSSYRKVTDNADSGVPYQGVAIITTTASSSARVIPHFNGGGSNPPIAAYSFRTDRQENPSVTQLNNGTNLNALAHNTTSSSPTVDFLVSQNVNPGDGGPSGNQYWVYSLPDNSTGVSFPNYAPPLLNPGSAIYNSRATFVPVGASDYFLQLLWQDPSNNIYAGLSRASTTTPGDVLPIYICPYSSCTTNPPGTDSPPYAGSSYVYAFGSSIGSGTSNATVEYEWPLDAGSAGVNRSNLGAIFPISVTSVGGGNVQMLAAAATQTDAGGIIFTLLTGTFPEANLYSFTMNDLKTVGSTLNDPDKAPVGQGSGFIAWPGHAAVIGTGSLVTSTGFNFILINAQTAQIEVFKGGTGQNLSPGTGPASSHVILSASMDYVPPSVSPSFGFDIAWVEQITPDGGSSYEAIFYERLQCDQ